MKNFFRIIYIVLYTTFTSFGGSQAVFPLIKKLACDKYKMINEEEYDHLVVITNSIPGPSVIQSLGYVSIKILGKFWGFMAIFLGLLPHILLFFAFYISIILFLPNKYLYVLNISVLPFVLAILIVFSERYYKQSISHFGILKSILVISLTFSFNFFIPTPYNQTFVPIIVFIFYGILEVYFHNKKKKFRK